VQKCPRGHTTPAADLDPDGQKYPAEALHVKQVTDDVSEYFPDSQSRQDDLEGALYVPGLHMLQTVADDAPRISLYVPALHSVHEPADAADLSVEYVPAAHGVHVADAAEEAYLPSPHGIHEVDAGGEDCPALHG
jgi:hypothetical protein